MIIGICGPAYSGKTTVALSICEKDPRYIILPFAESLKDMAREFGWDGKKDEKGRRFLQLLGTEIGRCYNPHYWVDRWEDAVIGTAEQFDWPVREACVIADDVRFPNEVAAVKSLGGIVIKIDAVQTFREQRARMHDETLPPAHASEQGVEGCDAEIDNNGRFDELLEAVRKILETYNV